MSQCSERVGMAPLINCVEGGAWVIAGEIVLVINASGRLSHETTHWVPEILSGLFSKVILIHSLHFSNFCSNQEPFFRHYHVNWNTILSLFMYQGNIFCSVDISTMAVGSINATESRLIVIDRDRSNEISQRELARDRVEGGATESLY